MDNIVNTVPYLRTSREFPTELSGLTTQVNKAYIDIANAVNNRTISIFPTNRPAITGESWFLNGNQRQQSFRQIYTFVGGSNPILISHGVDVTDITGFTKIYGTFTDGTNWYPLPYVDVVDVTNQVNIIITETKIQITGGGGGGQPVVSSGFVVLEWLSNL